MNFLDRLEQIRAELEYDFNIINVDEDFKMITLVDPTGEYNVWIATNPEYNDLVEKYKNCDLTTLLIDGEPYIQGYNLVIKNWGY